jgi:hypothetical protein
MIITVDSNVLLSIFTKDTLYDSSSMIMEKYSSHEYIINDCIYLELGVHFPEVANLDETLDILEVSLVKKYETNFDAILTAWKNYLKKKRFVCPYCGKTINPICPQCDNTLPFRQRILTNFFIGGFALANSEGMLTLDPIYSRNYFPQLRILD